MADQRKDNAMTGASEISEDRREFLREIGRKGGKARAQQESFREHNQRIAPLGQAAMRATFPSEGEYTAHMREIGRKGLRSLAEKLGTDIRGASEWLVEKGIAATDPVPENGVHQPGNFHAAVEEVAW
jgi:general stress protein YciG